MIGFPLPFLPVTCIIIVFWIGYDPFAEERVNKTVKKVRNVYYRALGHYPIVINGWKFKLDPYHVAFWRSIQKGRWEPYTYTVFEKFLNSGSIYCDVGAWIGPTVIYAAKKCRQVICFEPDPVAYRYLCWNIELNDLKNVTSFNIALADTAAMQRMSSFRGNLGDSASSLLNGNAEGRGALVQTMTWNAFLHLSKIDTIGFFKIDIEGGEFALLADLKDYLSSNKPVVYLSTHAPYLDVESRKEKMGQIADVMKIYKKCLNEDLQTIDIRELESEDALNQFRSYIFTD